MTSSCTSSRPRRTGSTSVPSPARQPATEPARRPRRPRPIGYGLMPRAAVLGSPIGQCLFPMLHLAAYDALELPDWRSPAVDCDEHRLQPLLAALDEEWVGLSVTRPLARLALEAADEVSPLAARSEERRVGKEGRWRG